MNTQVAKPDTIQDQMSEVAFMRGKVPESNDNYRFYHCYQHATTLQCKKVDSASTLSENSNTRLLFVNNYVPKVFDKYILKYMWIPNKVVIK